MRGKIDPVGGARDNLLRTRRYLESIVKRLEEISDHWDYFSKTPTALIPMLRGILETLRDAEAMIEEAKVYMEVTWIFNELKEE